MRFGFLLLCFWYVFSGCSVNRYASKPVTGCSKVTIVSQDEFDVATSEPYRLTNVRLLDSCLQLFVRCDEPRITSHRLLWSGRVSPEGSPPQISVQVQILKTEGKRLKRAKEHTLQYELKDLPSARPLLIYFMNDEKSFILE